MKKQKFEVETKFTFTGKFFVKAESREDAERMVRHSCGLVLGGNIHSNLNDEDVDWDFNMHPEQNIIKEDDRETIEVLQHTIAYSYREWDGEPDECDIEHLEKMIKEGYNQGELNTGQEEHSGWWEIKK